MNTPPTLLERVRTRLAEYRGANLAAVATDTGISYDTVLRIRDGKTDPAFSKVQTLAEYFKLPAR